ncbi:MAG: lytic transglycosylase [Candidatus Acididesulfobacter guangdongensis]|uniref:Lytic transglycosylase n=1 Tax=Acididesulfobacter guangdongensis TaxID=2597225 RepID=A0A519BEG9_ACIG2|nr:MAG: lytic transglycosylase [Candidatus Acididesulfobacter guangdongensis]
MKISYNKLFNEIKRLKTANTDAAAIAGVFAAALLISMIVLQLIYLNNAEANIYMRRGKNGTVYFSNVPVSNGYKVFMRTASKYKNKSYKILKYRKLIQKAAKRYGVNSRLISAVVRAESGYKKSAVSDKGAEGLMQLMPATQRMLNVSNPFNPAQNIFAGTKYLKSLLVKYNGNMSLALAAYNAGKNAVKQYGGIPPYSQTQNYVKEVVDYYNRYKKNK